VLGHVHNGVVPVSERNSSLPPRDPAGSPVQ
jgi:hypothetical protein